MPRSTQQDLFGDEPQAELFDPGDSPPAYRPDADKVRARLEKILAELRSAEKLPWDRDRTLLFKTIFPHMADWLPAEESAQLKFQFDTEIARLKAA